MQKKFIALALCLTALVACKKKEEAPAPAPVTATHATATEAPTSPPQTMGVTLPAGAPIPASGVVLWLVADDAKAGADGKISSWSNAAVPGATATADKPELQPSLASAALNGHAAVRFDGEQNMLMTNVDISPAKMPDVTIFAVFTSKTDKKAPLRKLYGDDNGAYDRAAGLDTRGGDHNYTVFAGSADVLGYFDLKADTPYITADQFTKSDFSGWVNGKAALQKVAATWGEALPNLYIGGTGTSYHEMWQGDLAEMIVYGRVLTDPERMQVEDYLGKKYGVAIAR